MSRRVRTTPAATREPGDSSVVEEAQSFSTTLPLGRAGDGDTGGMHATVTSCVSNYFRIKHAKEAKEAMGV